MKKSCILFVILVTVFTSLNAQGKLKAEYYNGINFEKYIGTNHVSNLDIYWNETPPIKNLQPDYCSVLYTGQLKSPITGVVTFFARVDDGIKVYINDTLIMSNWQLNDVGYEKGKFRMKADTYYNIKIEYFNAMREAELRLLWVLPADPNSSWFSRLWSREDTKLISPEYFFLPIDKNTPRA